jgi:hypothetical protein
MTQLDYQILPRALDAGGGHDVLLLRDGVEVDRKTFTANPDADPQAGMAWFNSLSDSGRGLWLAQAHSARPVDAYALYLHRDAFRQAEEAGQAWRMGA